MAHPFGACFDPNEQPHICLECEHTWTPDKGSFGWGALGGAEFASEDAAIGCTNRPEYEITAEAHDQAAELIPGYDPLAAENRARYADGFLTGYRAYFK